MRIKIETTKKDFFIATMLILSSVVYPVLFLYAANIKVIEIVNVLPILIKFLLFGIIIFGLLVVYFGNVSRAAIMGTAFVFLFCNYRLFEELLQRTFPFIRYWHALPIVFLILIFTAYVLNFKLGNQTLQNLCLVFTIALGSLIIFNIITVVSQGFDKLNAKQVTMDRQTQGTKDIASGPNIYLLIFDEYASFTQLKEYWKYNNDNFKNFLQDSKFAVSENSRNECTTTKVVLTNLINIDYVVDESLDDKTLETFRTNPPLYQVLRNNKYQLQGIGNTRWLGLENKLMASDPSAQTIEGYTFDILFLKNTMIYPFTYSSNTEDQELVTSTLDQLKNLKVIPNSSTFTLSYLKSPHQPFLYDEKGRDVSPANYHNWDEPQYYLGQLKFITNNIQEIIEKMIERDPGGIIVLCSDHGARSGPYKEPYSIRTTMLNAVYYKGEEIPNILGQSGVNTLRILLTKTGNGSYPLVEVPYADKK